MVAASCTLYISFKPPLGTKYKICNTSPRNLAETTPVSSLSSLDAAAWGSSPSLTPPCTIPAPNHSYPLPQCFLLLSYLHQHKTTPASLLKGMTWLLHSTDAKNHPNYVPFFEHQYCWIMVPLIMLSCSPSVAKDNALFWEEDCNQSREAKNTIPVAFARFQEYWVVKPQTPASKPVSLQTLCNFMIWNKYVLSSPYRRLGCIETPWKQPRRFKMYKESASDFLLRFIWAPLREKERDLFVLELEQPMMINTLKYHNSRQY